jgi:hypothetical protein
MQIFGRPVESKRRWRRSPLPAGPLPEIPDSRIFPLPIFNLYHYQDRIHAIDLAHLRVTTEPVLGGRCGTQRAVVLIPCLHPTDLLAVEWIGDRRESSRAVGRSRTAERCCRGVEGWVNGLSALDHQDPPEVYA